MQDVDEDVSSSDLENFRVRELDPMDPLQWMGAIRMRVQTADKNNNAQVIYTTPILKLISCEVKSCMSVINHQDVFFFFLLQTIVSGSNMCPLSIKNVLKLKCLNDGFVSSWWIIVMFCHILIWGSVQMKKQTLRWPEGEWIVNYFTFWGWLINVAM